MNLPCMANNYLEHHAKLLISSYRHITGRDLVDPALAGKESYKALFFAPFGVVSHDTSDDPIFNYANEAALQLFEMSWDDFTSLPSRKSAEPVNREERQRLLDRVSKDGFYDGYRGIRISATGNRFSIEESTIWNLMDESDTYRGQAAVIYKWTML